MTGFFWLAASAMSLLAIAFAGLPFFRNRSRSAKTVLALGISLPALTVGMYLQLGSPNVKSTHPGSTAAGQTGTAATESTAAKPVGSVASMVDALAARLEREPDDSKGWLLLAKSYKHLNRIDDAIAAYEKAAALGEFDASLTGLPLSSESAQASPAQIYGRVSLAPAAQGIVMPTDTVFVFARAVDGPPMPVAVLQRPASDLPIDFLLNDAQAMSGGSKLSDFDQVDVIARISRSGNATEALQGLEAKSGIISVQDNDHIELMIAPRN